MSLLKFICASTIVGAALTLSAHAQTVDPMRTACANEDYAHSNSDICVALAKTPVNSQPTPNAYLHLPDEDRPLPFYGTYEECLKTAQSWLDSKDFMSRPINGSSKQYCMPAK